MSLPIKEFLAAVAEHGVFAPEKLIERGHHRRVIEAKAEKAARRGYTDFGVAAHRAWLTEKGRQKLSEWGAT